MAMRHEALVITHFKHKQAQLILTNIEYICKSSIDSGSSANFCFQTMPEMSYLG